jgi:hypothetical protein
MRKPLVLRGRAPFTPALVNSGSFDLFSELMCTTMDIGADSRQAELLNSWTQTDLLPRIV